MNTYTISIIREIHYKMDVSAESLAKAIEQVEASGLDAGRLIASGMTESQELDEEGIILDNLSRFPDEVARFSGLTAEQLTLYQGPFKRSTR